MEQDIPTRGGLLGNLPPRKEEKRGVPPPAAGMQLQPEELESDFKLHLF